MRGFLLSWPEIETTNKDATPRSSQSSALCSFEEPTTGYTLTDDLSAALDQIDEACEKIKHDDGPQKRTCERTHSGPQKRTGHEAFSDISDDEDEGDKFLKTVDDHHRQIRLFHSRYVSTVELAKQERNRFDTELKDVRSSLREAQEECIRKSAEVTALTTSLEECKAQIRSLENERDERNLHLTATQNQIAKLQETLAEREANQNQFVQNMLNGISLLNKPEIHEQMWDGLLHEKK